jgi:MoxR-like ATPase
MPQVQARLARQIVGVVQQLRREELEKVPGIAEMIDWAAAFLGMSVNDMAQAPDVVQATMVCLLKTAADRAAAPREVLDRLIGKVA